MYLCKAYAEINEESVSLLGPWEIHGRDVCKYIEKIDSGDMPPCISLIREKKTLTISVLTIVQSLRDGKFLITVD